MATFFETWAPAIVLCTLAILAIVVIITSVKH